MPIATLNGIELHYEDRGSAAQPAVLLIMGLAMPMTAWPPALVETLREAGYRVICFDNRDAGKSQRIDAPPPAPATLLFRKLCGLPIRAPYSLADMADDAVCLLDHLGVEQAHIVGASMGGMIAQRLVLNHPQRALSLTSIMSTTGALRYSFPHWSVMRAMMKRPEDTLDGRLAYGRTLWQLIQSPGDPPSVDELEALLITWYGDDAMPGTERQLAAVAADRPRKRELGTVAIPSLVIHGLADRMISSAAGVATADAIPFAQFVGFQGMGHDFRPRYLTEIGNLIIRHTRHV